ncbi:MAG: hypothetical protein CMB95_07185 [Flavobacteriaceae bacterium]|nr:hypothetical protein [Flavobacteriaceae bacterium]
MMGRRKVKNRLVPVVEKVFTDSKRDVLPFDEIMRMMTTSKSVLAGILSSYPDRFDPAGTERSRHGSEEYRRTLWRLVPDTSVTKEEIQVIYNLTDEEMALISTENGFRFKCWQADKDGQGWNRRDIHYIVYQLKKDLEKQRLSKKIKRV